MKRTFFVIISTCVMITGGISQTKKGTSFDGTFAKDPSVCAEGSGNFLSEKQVEDLITEILRKIGTKNRYIIVNCTQVENCQAILYKGKPYILYNPNFLGKVKKLSFSSSMLPEVASKDWETLTILAHELGHHVNNHLLNPLPDATQPEMELEADETAGFIIYLLGGTLNQAQTAYFTVPETGNYTHPAKQKRLEAIAKGWNEAHGSLKNEFTLFDIEGHAYKTVSNGTQVWMAENLNTSRFRNGDLIPEARTAEEWKIAGEQSKPAWCYFDNNVENGKQYGKLYNWYAVNDPRGLAPEGWRVPTNPDWATIISNLGGELVAGSKMKTASGLWTLPNTGATNSSGFSAVPGGARTFTGTFNRIGTNSYFWVSTQSDKEYGFGPDLSHERLSIFTGRYYKGEGFSVRCIKIK